MMNVENINKHVDQLIQNYIWMTTIIFILNNVLKIIINFYYF